MMFRTLNISLSQRARRNAKPLIGGAFVALSLAGQAFAGATIAHLQMKAPERSARRSSTTSLSTIIDTTLLHTGLPAIAAAVITTDRIEGYDSGVRKVGAPDLVRKRDLWHLGSCEKSMTSTMIARLVERGRLRWDTTIGDVLPEVMSTARPEYRDVTLDQLLRHRGGIVPLESFSDVTALPSFTGTVAEQRVKFAQYALTLPPAAAPGIGFAYSNGGYTIAAAMAERVTGVPYEQLMTQLLFAPLNINAKFDWPTAGDPNEPWGHQDLGSGSILPIDLTQPAFAFPKIVEPAGNISLSIGDLARYVQLHLRGLRAEGRLLEADTFRHLHHPTRAPGDAFGYADGWVETSINGVPTSFHDGSAIAFYAVMYLQPSRNRAVVLATNQFDQVSVDTLNAIAIQILTAS